jgi:putative ABC transport system permease protein
MNILDSCVSAIQNLYGNKARSILTALGIIIGISAVILLTSIGRGYQNMMTREFEKMGLSGLEISLDSGKEQTSGDRLTLGDLDMLSTHRDIRSATPVLANLMDARLRNPAESAKCYAYGTTPGYAGAVEDVELLYGRFLSRQDVQNASRIAVISEDLSKRAFGRSNSVGGTIRVTYGSGASDLTVVGVYRGNSFLSNFMPYSFLYMPITALQQMSGYYYVDYISVSASRDSDIEALAGDIVRLLSAHHRNDGKYAVTNLFSQMDSVDALFGGITVFVSLVAFISLFVGGIGVMNIMLITVRERTREIGVRKALGATDANIRFLFLLESVLLSVLGGIVGVLVGYYGSFSLCGLMRQVLPVEPDISVQMIIVSVAASSAVGIIFGVYPASRAAKLEPIDALRFE